MKQHIWNHYFTSNDELFVGYQCSGCDTLAHLTLYVNMYYLYYVTNLNKQTKTQTRTLAIDQDCNKLKLQNLLL